MSATTDKRTRTHALPFFGISNFSNPISSKDALLRRLSEAFKEQTLSRLIQLIKRYDLLGLNISDNICRLQSSFF